MKFATIFVGVNFLLKLLRIRIESFFPANKNSTISYLEYAINILQDLSLVGSSCELSRKEVFVSLHERLVCFD